MQKPVDKRGINNSRDGMWKAMMDLGTFTIKDISDVTRINEGTAAGYLEGLVAAGYVSVKCAPDTSPKTRNVYTLEKRQRETPRVRKDGTPILQGRGTEQMWRSMKMLKFFTPFDLSVAASTKEIQVNFHSAKDYIYYLNKAGYLRIVKKSSPGKQAAYALKHGMYTGPKPPKIQRVKQVFDPNLGRVVWPVEGANS